MNGLSLALHTVPSEGSSPVCIYFRTCRAMPRLVELIMQWPSEFDAKTTEPGQREAMAWALYVASVSGYLVVRRMGFREKLTFEAV